MGWNNGIDGKTINLVLTRRYQDFMYQQFLSNKICSNSSECKVKFIPENQYVSEKCSLKLYEISAFSE